MYEVELYRKEGSGRAPVEDFLKDLYKKNLLKETAEIYEFIQLLAEQGMNMEADHPRSIKHIRDKLYELRPGANRVFFFSFDGTKIVLLHAYRKRSKRTPDREIEQAMREMKDYNRRNPE